MSYRCALADIQPERPDPEEMKREGWQQQGILVIAVDDQRLDWVQRGFVSQIGEALYGKRREKCQLG